MLTLSSSSLATLLLLIVVNLLSSLKISSFKGVVFVSATIQCTVGDNGNKLCEEKYRKGSYCTSNERCSNPFHKGCLQAVLPENFTNKLRTCNSDDYNDDTSKEEDDERELFCTPANEQFDYEEVRILSQNWESARFSSWIMQIVLSELLNVPTTIETSMFDDQKSGSSFNFYAPELRFSYSKESYVRMNYVSNMFDACVM